jgi:hypothetical protein
LIRQQLARLFRSSLRENHLAHGIDTLALKEHVFRWHRPIPVAPESRGASGLLGRIGIRSNLRRETFEHQSISCLYIP